MATISEAVNRAVLHGIEPDIANRHLSLWHGHLEELDRDPDSSRGDHLSTVFRSAAWFVQWRLARGPTTLLALGTMLLLLGSAAFAFGITSNFATFGLYNLTSAAGAGLLGVAMLWRPLHPPILLGTLGSAIFAVSLVLSFHELRTNPLLSSDPIVAWAGILGAAAFVFFAWSLRHWRSKAPGYAALALAVTSWAYSLSNLHGMFSYETEALRYGAAFAFVVEVFAGMSFARWAYNRPNEKSPRTREGKRSKMKRKEGNGLVHNERRLLLGALEMTEAGRAKFQGYALNKQLDRDGKKLVPSTLYRSLDRMRDDGLVEDSPQKTADSGRTLHNFSLTPAGTKLAVDLRSRGADPGRTGLRPT